MLARLAALFAPPAVDVTDVPLPELRDASLASTLAERASEAFEIADGIEFRPRGERSAYRHLWAMGGRDILTREADQDPRTAGLAPNYARFPAFEPVEIPVEGAVLHGHRSTGAPGAPVVIVLHGLFDSHVSRYVVEYAEVLRRWGFHVVALDLRDHGRLRGREPAMSLGLFEGRDVFAAARTLAEAEGVSVGLLGFSYGGQVAVRAAYEAACADAADVFRGGVLTICAPLNIHEAVLALDDPEARLPHPKSFIDRRIFAELVRTFHRHRDRRIRELDGLDHFIDRYDEFIRESVLKAYPDEPQLVGAFLGKARAAQPSVMSRIASPTLLVHSADDPLVPTFHALEAMKAADGNPLVQMKLVPAGGHVALQEEDADATLRLLSSFFGTLRDG